MNQFSLATLTRLILRAVAIVFVLSAPVLALPAFGDSAGTVIEAPAAPKSGMGFVLLVSLQRV